VFDGAAVERQVHALAVDALRKLFGLQLHNLFNLSVL
jgi:hypothetical protein